MLGLKRGEVKIVPYDSKWKEDYETESMNILNNITSGFGKSFLNIEEIEIHHIGSTAIENLSSKPIVDIMLVIEPFDLIASIISGLLMKMGYRLIGVDMEEKWLFNIRQEDGKTIYHLHIVGKDSEKYKGDILFRDFLRNNDIYIKEYEKIKEELAKIYPNDRQEYSRNKRKFIEKVISIIKNSNFEMK